MADDMTDAYRQMARAMLPHLGGTAEAITPNEAVRTIQDRAADQLPPAVAKLLKRLAIQEVAGVLPASLKIPLLDVGRELRAAALPYLNTAEDSETAEPELIMGTHPDGAPRVISAEFAGPTVRVNGHGILRLYGKAVAPWEAHRIAKGLLAAIAWLENDGAAKAEAAASPRGEQGE